MAHIGCTIKQVPPDKVRRVGVQGRRAESGQCAQHLIATSRVHADTGKPGGDDPEILGSGRRSAHCRLSRQCVGRVAAPHHFAHERLGLWANVQFAETNTDPQVRIARTRDDGYWSYLGTDVLSIPDDEPTMNLDSFTMNTADSEFHRVVRHETGHTLGFPHEHMRKEIIDRIDREKAIALFMRTQGWSREEVIAQVLTPFAASALKATAATDVNSIMCYDLPASIMKDGIAVPGGKDIDNLDAAFAAKLYPGPVRRLPFGPTARSISSRARRM